MEDMEIEVKLNLTKDQFEQIQTRFKADNIPCISKDQRDTYFAPKGDDNYFGKPIINKCLRFRFENQKTFLNYKHIVFGTTDLDTYIQEFETEIGTPEQLKLILRELDVIEVLTVHKTRYVYVYKEHFEIALDIVENLGYFVEIEMLNTSVNIKSANLAIIDVVNELGLDMTQRNSEGYSNLMYKKITGIRA